MGRFVTRLELLDELCKRAHVKRKNKVHDRLSKCELLHILSWLKHKDSITIEFQDRIRELEKSIISRKRKKRKNADN